MFKKKSLVQKGKFYFFLTLISHNAKTIMLVLNIYRFVDIYNNGGFLQQN